MKIEMLIELFLLLEVRYLKPIQISFLFWLKCAKQILFLLVLWSKNILVRYLVMLIELSLWFVIALLAIATYLITVEIKWFIWYWWGTLFYLYLLSTLLLFFQFFIYLLYWYSNLSKVNYILKFGEELIFG